MHVSQLALASFFSMSNKITTLRALRFTPTIPNSMLEDIPKSNYALQVTSR